MTTRASGFQLQASGKKSPRRVPSARHLISTTLLIAFALLCLTASAADNKKKSKTGPVLETIEVSKLVWPPAPDVARIKWTASTRGEDDLNPSTKTKKKSSWMDKMAGVTLPSESRRPTLGKPFGVAVDSKGLIYVADPANGAVFVFDLENKKVTTRGAQELAKPAGVALDDSDRLFVSDAAQGQVFVYRPDGSLETAIGRGRLQQPVGLAIDDENRYLYVVDGGANRLAVFDADDYKLIRYQGTKSDPGTNAPGTFDRPSFAAVDGDGNVYVTDTFNARVQVFNAEGDFVRMWGKPGNSAGRFMRPKGIALDADGHIYIVDSEFNNVQVFDTEGNTLMFFGDRGYAPGTFMLASGIAIDKSNRIIVSEQWNARIQVFRYITDQEAAPEYEKLAKVREQKAKEEAEALRIAAEKAAQAEKDSAGKKQ